MKWYVADIVVRCRVQGAPGSRSLFEHQIKVLRAATPEAAYQRSNELGRAENHAYRNDAGERVRWQFVGLADLEELLENRITDGTEIHSRRQRGHPKAAVRRKRDLSVFWSERNKDRTAAELLSGRVRNQGATRATKKS